MKQFELAICAVFALQTLTAQTIFEAEASNNIYSGSGAIGQCRTCSGGKNAQDLGGPNDGRVTFNGINAATAGNYAVVITFDNGSSGTMTSTISVNGRDVMDVAFPATGSWFTLRDMTVTLPFVAGNNSIAFRGALRSNGSISWVAEIDKISVSAPIVVQPPPNNPPPPDDNPPPPPPPPTGSRVLITTFGNVGKGSDDTKVFQNGINSTASKLQVLEIPAGTYNVKPLSFPNNASMLLDANATVQATTGYSSSQKLLNVVGVSNVNITGTPGSSIFKMRKSEYKSGEYRHCLDIEGSDHITIAGIACNDSGGDGLYIGSGSRGYSSDISVSSSTFNNNRRQGFSLISGKNITIDSCTFSNTIGTLPESGIDIEPNLPSEFLQNIVFTNNKSTGNHGHGFLVSVDNLNSNTAPISVSISGHISSGNTRSGYFATNGHLANIVGATGTITIQNSFSTNDGEYGAVTSYYDAGSPHLTFQNLTVSNANGSGSNYDGAAIGIKRGGGGYNLMGGVTFTGASITATNGKLQHYFTIEDYSHIGLKDIHIDNFGTLSGIPSNNSLGVVNDVDVNSVNIP